MIRIKRFISKHINLEEALKSFYVTKDFNSHDIDSRAKSITKNDD